MKCKKVWSFIIEFNKIAPYILDNILDRMEEEGYLSDEGHKFRDKFWQMVIKDSPFPYEFKPDWGKYKVDRTKKVYHNDNTEVTEEEIGD